MATLSLISHKAASAEVPAVFVDIRNVRGTDVINNIWRALAHYPVAMKSMWERLKVVMDPGNPDPPVREMICIAASTPNGCEYCINSHAAAAKAKGTVQAQHGALVSVIAMAMQTNGLVTVAQVPLDELFMVET